MTNFPKPTIVISKCIGFDSCRYNGGVVHDKFAARLTPHIEIISVCPEVEIGLGIPRAPVRIICCGDELKLIQPSSGLDLSESMRGFTAGFLDSLEKVDGFILKNRSPSCGFTDVKFYSGPERGPAIGRTGGLFGGAVLQKFGDLAVEDEGRLKNLSIREHFLTRIFALARLRKLQQSGSMHSLERFHLSNHLLLMAYSQTKLSELERIVTNADGEQTAIVLNLYARHFREALRKPVRRASPINVLMYALGYLKKKLSASEQLHFLEILESYRLGRAPLCSATSILKSWVIRFKSKYLRDQTFFNPFPEELMTLDDSGGSRT